MKIATYRVTNTSKPSIIIQAGEDRCSLRLDDIGDILHAMLLPCDKGFTGVAWELDATVAPILRLLDIGKLRRLYEFKKTWLRPYSIYYMPGKLFSIKYGAYKMVIYDLSQYYPEEEEPAPAALLLKANDLIAALDTMNLYPQKLTSPVAIYEDAVLKNLSLPTGWDMPDKAAEYAYNCSGKLWIEAYQLGHFDKAYDYDMSGCFPNIAMQLPDFRNFTWHRHGTTRTKPKLARYGYYRVRLNISPDVMIHPFFFSDQEGNIRTAGGSWDTYLTLNQILFIRSRGLGVVEVIDGYWCEGIINHYPLENILKRLLAFKNHANPLISRLAKRMSVGVYGKFGEEWQDSFGPYFNPCFFSEISSRASMMVADFIYNNFSSSQVIHVSVDGVLCTVPAKNVDGLWSLSGTAPALVLSSGLLFQGNKRPKGLTYDRVTAMIKDHPKLSFYEAKIARRVTLGQAIQSGRLQEIGTFRDMFSSIDFNLQEHDRIFQELPATGGQAMSNHYSSKPFIIMDE
ncbi:hypothetical protein LCGC14_0686640 [marine sediment metagenome]|uniref:Uncharacterized protein n=1 Tax=marine sediment metagenome TaxID=412755 RepID=A0A0F9R6Z4_9ZZZZ